MAAGGRPGVEVEGAKELRKAFKKMDGRLDDLKAVHQAAGEIVAQKARSIVPTRTGRLAGSIRTDRRASGAAVLAGRSRIPYAGVIHWGWPKHNIEPQPFLYDALDARREEVADKYEKKVSELVRTLDREAP